MYLRRHSKKVGSECYDYWSLVESARTAKGPRQRIVATIGKLPGLDKEERIGWEEIRRILDGQPIPQPDLFEPSEDPPSWATININRVSVERLRSFGDVYLGLLLWGKLGFAGFCQERIPSGREEIPWHLMVSILVLARFCSPSSELQIAEVWYDKTALDDFLGVPGDKINDDRLYRALDVLLPTKTSYAVIFSNGMVNFSAPRSTFSSMTSPLRILKEICTATPKQNEDIAGTAVPTVRK